MLKCIHSLLHSNSFITHFTIYYNSQKPYSFRLCVRMKHTRCSTPWQWHTCASPSPLLRPPSLAWGACAPSLLAPSLTVRSNLWIYCTDFFNLTNDDFPAQLMCVSSVYNGCSYMDSCNQTFAKSWIVLDQM